MEQLTNRQRCLDDFAPIRAWAKANQGSINALTEKIAQRTGGNVNRHMVGRWLKADDPVEPGYGYGKALIEAYTELATHDDQEATEAPSE